MPIRVRRALFADADAIAGVHFHSWQASVRGRVPDEVLGELSLLQGCLRWRTRLSDDSGRERTYVACEGFDINGFCRLVLPSPDDDADAHTAQVASLYVMPGHWRRGIGSALLSTALASLARADWHEATLWALSVSTRAQAFYAQHGFVADGAIEIDPRYGVDGLRPAAFAQRCPHHPPAMRSRKTTWLRPSTVTTSQ